MRLAKIIGIWAAIAGLLFWNGVAGLALWNPLFGRDSGEMLTMMFAITIIFGVSRAFLVGESLRPRRQVLRMSAAWMVLTLIFEAGLGQLGQIAGPEFAPRHEMWDGSFWPLVVLTMGIAPVTWLRHASVPIGGVTK